jgi:hypothetical protein
MVLPLLLQPSADRPFRRWASFGFEIGQRYPLLSFDFSVPVALSGRTANASTVRRDNQPSIPASSSVTLTV